MIGISVGDRIHLDQLRAKRTDGVLLLLALRARHHDNRAIAESIADNSQTNTRIARRAFDDDAAGLQSAGFFRIPDHAERRAILHRLPRIQEFGLAVDIGPGQL